MDWLFTLAIMIVFAGLGVACHQLWLGGKRNLHKLYGAVFAVLLGGAGLWHIFQASLVDSIAGHVPIFLFAVAIILGSAWEHLSTKLTSGRVISIRLLACVGYLAFLFVLTSWHRDIASPAHTINFGFATLLLGFVSGYFAYHGTRWLLGVIVLLWIAAGLLINVDPVLFKGYYVPLWLILFSLAVSIGLLPRTIRVLWRPY